MTEPDRFEVPARRVIVEREVRHSRFIATVDLVRDRAGFEALLARAREVRPDANHHCWAYLAGPPGDLRYADQSDDGEPRGTAGRPMLTVLQHAGLGQVGVVVTRYFGGIKLGTGGLARAYGQAVRQVLGEELPTRVEFVTRRAEATVPYALLASVDYWLESTDIAVTHRHFGESVVLSLRIPLADLDAARAAFARLGQGAIELRTR